MKFYGGSTAFYGKGNSSAYFYGSATAGVLVPLTYNCSIGGRPYVIDFSQPFYRQYHRQLAPLIRTQADTSNLPGENSLDPNGLWRRSFEDWTDGAGQRYLDRNGSVDNSFWVSKGVDPFTQRWQVSLLPEVANANATSSNTNLYLVLANGYIYKTDGQTLAYTASLTPTVSWTTVTGTAADTISSIATDGYNVYIAQGAGGLYQTVAGTATASQLVTSALGASAVVGYVNGRLMIGNSGSGGDGKLYNIVSASPAALPTALFAPGNPNAVWVGFAEGNTNLYAAANIGGKGIIYGTAVVTDGTALSPPSIQGALPNGEAISSILGYLGSIVVGSTLGVRYVAETSAGLNLGSLITTTSAVSCLVGYQRWVYFGMTNYDGTSTGLGRLDLGNFVVEGLLPAYCTDRMATAQGAVTGAAFLSGVAILAVSGVGFFADDGNLVSSGTIQSGYILYDLTEPKIPALLDMQTVGPLTHGSYSAQISVDGGAFQGVGTAAVGSGYPVTFGVPSGTSGERFEILVTLNRDTTTTSAGPTLTRWTLRSYPAPRRAVTWQLPLIFDPEIINPAGTQVPFDPLVELEALELMAAMGQPVTYQEADESWQVWVQDIEFLADTTTEDRSYMQGLCLVQLQSLPVPYQGAA